MKSVYFFYTSQLKNIIEARGLRGSNLCYKGIYISASNQNTFIQDDILVMHSIEKGVWKRKERCATLKCTRDRRV